MTPESLKVKEWREANKDRYNARMKAYMKARREKKRQQEALTAFTVVQFKEEK